jgi:putative transcriptional regulator
MTLPLMTAADIKALRALLGFSQVEFAARYHLSLDALQNWEQGRRAPDPAASAYLHLIAFNPVAAADALAWVAARKEKP